MQDEVLLTESYSVSLSTVCKSATVRNMKSEDCYFYRTFLFG